MKRLLACFLRDERGVTAIEYALIGGFISIVIVASVSAIGGELGGIFESAAAGFEP